MGNKNQKEDKKENDQNLHKIENNLLPGADTPVDNPRSSNLISLPLIQPNPCHASKSLDEAPECLSKDTNQQRAKFHQQVHNPSQCRSKSTDIFQSQIAFVNNYKEENKKTCDEKELNDIVNCMKKCNEYYASGMQMIKERNHTKGVEILKKAHNGMLKLEQIVKQKSYLPIEFSSKVITRLQEGIALVTAKLSQIQIDSKAQLSLKASTLDNHIVSQSISIQASQLKGKENTGDVKKKSIPQDIYNKIQSEIMLKNPGVKFDDIVGMNDIKQIIKEIIIIPSLRPDLFTGIRTPQRGLLLFGPPGTGKTLIAKAIASECKRTFFNISASSLTSKYVGESEKLVKCLFQVAYDSQPSIIFIDEIESILSKRTDSENDASKRLKTEFLIQFDGLSTNLDDKLLVIAATNRPQDLDDALLRRLPKRVYCGPLDQDGRISFIQTILKQTANRLSIKEIGKIAELTNNYSNSDLKELCREAAFEPVREVDENEMKKIKKFRPLEFKDFKKALTKIRGTINSQMLAELEVWNTQYGALY